MVPFGGLGDDQVTSIAALPGGGTVMAGAFSSSSLDVDGTVLANMGGMYDGFAVELGGCPIVE